VGALDLALALGFAPGPEHQREVVMTRAVRVLSEGIYFGEGPRWHDGRLWFSDFYAKAVKSISLAGDLRTELEIDDRPSGLGWTPDGSLLVVSMTKRQVLRRAPGGAGAVHADLSGIATFHCNDMVVDAAGGAYVGNFGFDLDAAIEARGIPSVLAEHTAATLAYVAPDGTVSAASGDMHFPNGPVITPDGKTLILGETLGGVLTAFDIQPGGKLSNRRVWAETSPRVPDGICLDAEGAIWVANPIAPECVRFAEGGAVLEVIETEMPCYACMLGGEDGRTLFMLTAPSSLAHVAAAAPKGKLLVATVDVPRAGRP
jgi:sugar lactone lactonase YvrE